MPLMLRFVARSDVGLVRDGNEDSLYAGPRLLAVADGMGGHAAGEVASAVAIASLAPLDRAADSDLTGELHRALEVANRHLREMMNAEPELEGMGTTVTALLWDGSRLGLMHVGDSRGYLLRDGRLRRITRDHSLVQALVDEGRLTEEQASVHPQRSVITQALDGRVDVTPDLSVREVQRGDRYLLCTDGLTDVLAESTIEEVLRLPDQVQAADRLIDLALRGGGPDNITCIVADIVNEPGVGDTAVVAGALAGPGSSGLSPDSDAGRAALAVATRQTTGFEPRHETAPAEPPSGQPAPRRRLRRRLAVTALTLAVLAAAAGGSWWYVRSQYYVGTEDEHVAIYRGVHGSVAGVSFASVHARLPIQVRALPPFERERVQQGISAGSLQDARRISERLRTEQEQAATPTVSVSATASSPPGTAPPTVTPTSSPTAAGATGAPGPGSSP